jgi:hypothetical protein
MSGRVRRHTRDEGGASLIAVIIFVTIFGVVTSAILQFAGTGLRATKAVREERAKLVSADGAIDGAINAIRGSKKGLPSEGECPTFTLSANGSDPEVTVTCQAVGTATGGIFDDQPAWAILTLGKDSDQGINKTGNFHTVISGGIFSSKDITTDGGPDCKDISDDSCNALTVYGDALALGTCTPNDGATPIVPTRLFTTTGGELTCLAGEPDAEREARGEDPGYPTALGSPASLDALTAAQVITLFGSANIDPPGVCQASNTIVRFQPGLYTEQLKNLVPAACSGAPTWWLAPSATSCTPGAVGIYYFDFSDGAANWSLADDGRDVVGGRIASCTGAAVATATPSWPTVSTDAPPCVDDDNTGVQLIFGGQSRLTVKNNSNRLGICSGKANSAITNQRIILYGLPSGTRPTAVTNEIKAGSSPTSTQFSAVTLAKSIVEDNDFAHADLTGGAVGGVGAVKTATLTMSAFDDIPFGSTITAASLEVVHKETAPATKPFTITGTWKSVDRYGNAVAATQNCTGYSANTAVHTDTCDLLPALQNATFGPYVWKGANGLNTAAITFASDLAAASLGGCNSQGKNCKDPIPAETATVDVDAVRLKVSYIPPGFEAHEAIAYSDCSDTGSAIFKSCNNPVTAVLGTVYAPTARMVVNVHNNNFTSFSRGVIVKTIDLDASASNKLPEQSPISLPGSGGTPPRIVLFTATVDSAVRARARIQYIDKDASGEFIGYEVKVLEWQVVR